MSFLSEAVCVRGVTVITPQCHHTTVLLGWCLRASARVLAAVPAQPWSCRAVDVQGLSLALCAAVAHWLRGGSVCNTLITAALLVQSTKQRLKKIDFLSLTPPFFCFFLVFVQLAIPPHSTSQLPVRFCPSALGRRNHKATITLKCPKV